jgi:Rieske Fe-S protein
MQILNSEDSVSQKEITRRELLKVLLGLPLLGLLAGAISPILRLLKPFGKLGLAIPPPSVARVVLSSMREPMLAGGGTSFADVEANYNSMKEMLGYSFEIVTIDTSIPTKPVKISNPGILIKDKEGKLHVWDAKCTHLACVIYWDSVSNNWHCRCHDGFFDPVTANVIAGPPPSALKPWKVEWDQGSGAITVEKV